MTDDGNEARSIASSAASLTSKRSGVGAAGSISSAATSAALRFPPRLHSVKPSSSSSKSSLPMKRSNASMQPSFATPASSKTGSSSARPPPTKPVNQLKSPAATSSASGASAFPRHRLANDWSVDDDEDADGGDDKSSAPPTVEQRVESDENPATSRHAPRADPSNPRFARDAVASRPEAAASNPLPDPLLSPRPTISIAPGAPDIKAASLAAAATEKEEFAAEMDRFHAPGDAIKMAVIKQTFKERYGVAYYMEATNTICAGEVNDLLTLSALKAKLRPSIIVTPSKRNDSTHTFLSTVEKQSGQQFLVKSVGAGDFNFDSAQSRLRLLQIEDMVPTAPITGKPDKTLYLMSVLNFDNNLTIQAVGGLLSHMFRSRLTGELERDSEMHPLSIRSIQQIPELKDYLYTDALTQRALAIFRDEVHPGYSSTKKEGLSVFGCLDKCKTKRGSRMLWEWLMYPSRNKDVITRRLTHVELFLLPQLTEVCTEIRKQLRSVKDLERILGKFLGVRARYTEFVSLRSTLASCIAIHAIAQKFEHNEIPLFDDLRPLIQVKDVLTLSKMIGIAACFLQLLRQPLWVRTEHVIDFEETKREDGNIRVRAGVSIELDALKRHLAGLPEFLMGVGRDDMKMGILGNVAAFAYDYKPQLGYLVKIPPEHAPTDDVDINSNTPYKLEWQFRADEFVYYKNARTRELDQELGDLQGMITDTERSIIRELENGVVSHAPTLKKIGSVLCELDCLLSLATAAAEFSLVRPKLVEENTILIDGGRHLVSELVIDRQFIPNHTNLDLADEKNGRLIHLITGPNASGKSVYLKQVGLITYMAHVGSFVPARSAAIGLVDKILSKLKTVDSVASSSLSSFSADTAEISFALRQATARSLVLIDEYGQGTVSYDGIGLLASVIQHLDARGVDCPKALIATHFHGIGILSEMFTHGLVQETPRVRFMRMDCIIQDAKPKPITATATDEKASEIGSKPSDEKSATQSTPSAESPLVEMVPLYTLKGGLSEKSFGFYCATLAGMPSAVTTRAKHVAHCFATRKPLLPEVQHDEAAEENQQIYREFEQLAANETFQLNDAQSNLRIAAFMTLINKQPPVVGKPLVSAS